MASASSMPSLGERQHLKSLLECSICLETFDDPRTLPCLHSFCKKCLENFVDGKHKDELNCPVCRRKFTLNKEGVAGMTRNHFICNMVEVLSIQQDKCIPCSHCEQPSVGRCVTCELFMCDKCFKPHNEYPGFKDHVVLTMEELSKPENQSKIKGKSYCKKHSSKKLKLYCKTCKELICSYCMSFEHVRPDHVCSPLEEIAETKREELKAKCKKLQSTVAKENNEMDVLKKHIESLNNDFDKTQRLVNKTKEQLLAKVRDIVDKKANSMIEDARQVFDRNTRILEERVDYRESFVNRAKSSIDMARSLIQNGNDEEIVRCFQSVVNNATEDNFNSDTIHGSVPSWSSDEIETTLLADINDIVQNKAVPVPSLKKIVTTNEQWYSSDEGMVHLQLLFQYFQAAGITPEMSRDSITQNTQFGFSGGYYLDFPANFPKRMPTIHTPDGKMYEVNRGSSYDEDVCQNLVNTVTKFLRNPRQSPNHGYGRGGRRYYRY